MASFYTHTHTHTHTHTLTWYLWKVVKLFTGVEHCMRSPTEETNPFCPHLVVCIFTLYNPEKNTKFIALVFSVLFWLYLTRRQIFRIPVFSHIIWVKQNMISFVLNTIHHSQNYSPVLSWQFISDFRHKSMTFGIKTTM